MVTNSPSSLQHHFLIAMPALDNSIFHRSVVYVCEHDEQGAMGIIVNKPTKVMLKELLDHLEIDNPSSKPQSIPVLFGGPVHQDQGLVIHNHSDDNWRTSLTLSHNIALTTSTDILEKIGSEQGPKKSLVTLGYAGWDSGQLEQEIADNSWLIVEADDDIIFNTPADERWHAAAELLGFDINLMPDIVGHA
ncbi:MAG: YqgE/AlgH family protein [Gammaproteobacteria bacterium]|nr:MAG: YqgE/AlgH family protein [Gammaproteobacteria bacterium]